MSLTVDILNGKQPSAGVGGVSDANFSELAVDFLTAGVVGSGDFAASPQGTPNTTAQVAAGIIYVRNSASTMVYRVANSVATASPAFGSNSSGNPRIDALVLKIDLGATPNNLANNVVSLVIVAGTPNVSPSAPSDATCQSAVGAGNVFVRLKEFTLPSGWTVIDNTIVSTDKRIRAHLNLPATVGASAKVPLNFVPRPRPASFDSTTQNFSWQQVSLQSIVGTSAVRVRIEVIFDVTNTSGRAMFAKGSTFTVSSTTPDTANDSRIMTIVSRNGGATGAMKAEFDLDLDATQNIQTFIDAVAGTVNVYGLTVTGWWEPS